MKEFNHYLFENYLFIIGLVSCIGVLIFFKKSIEIASLIVFAFIVDRIAEYLSIRHIHNMWLYNGTIIIETGIIFLIIYKYYLNKLKHKKTIIGMFYTYLSCSIFYYLSHLSNEDLNIYGYLPAALVIAFISYFFLLHITENMNEAITKNIFFWFSMANMIYYTGSISIVGTMPWFAHHHPELHSHLYFINNILYAIWYLLILIGFISCKKTPQKSYFL